MNFLLLFFAHCVGDFVLQSEWMAKQKTIDSYIMFLHSVLWSGCICLILYYLNSFNIYKGLFLLLGHFGSDTLKAKQTFLYEKPAFFLDQLWHIVQLGVVYLLK